jgi:hypothetical protein
VSVSIKDLKKSGPGVYRLFLPDGREFRVGKIPWTKVIPSRSFVYEGIAWAVHIIDWEADVAQIQEGYDTRKAAFEAGMKWSAENPREAV